MYLRLLPIGEGRTSDLFSDTLEHLTTQELFDLGSTTGRSSIGVGSTSTTVSFTTGLSPIGVKSISNPPYTTYGNSAIGISSSSKTHITSTSKGTAPIGLASRKSSGDSFKPYLGVDSKILIPIELSGVMSPGFPPPTPPVNFAGLPNPVTAPTATKSITANGRLIPGAYRYSYAAWKGSPEQATAPSPILEVTVTTQNTVTLVYAAIAGAEGYLIYREDL